MNDKQQGMTLVELMITVAVMGILATVAFPSLSQMLENNRLTAINNQLVSSIHYTRNEAVKRAMNVSMCVSRDGNTCASSGSFQDGWIIFNDCGAKPNKTPDTLVNVCDYYNNATKIPVPDGIVDSPEEILQVFRPDYPGISITNSSNSPRLINYRLNGNVSSAGRLTVSKESQAVAQIVMSFPTGRIRTCKLAVGQSKC